MKQRIASILSLIMLLAIIPFNSVFADGKKEVVIEDLVYPREEIHKGDRFGVGFKITNNLGEKMENVKVEYTYGSYHTINQSNVLEIGDINEGSAEVVPAIMLIYNGGESTRAGFKVTYTTENNFTEQTKSFYIQLKAVPDTGDVSGSTGDSKNYKPNLILKNGELPVAYSGEFKDVTLEVENKSDYNAKNIAFEALLKSNEIFELGELSPIKRIESLESGKTSKITYKVNVKDGVKSGVYPIEINYSYENEYKDRWEQNKIVAYIKVIANDKNESVELKKLNQTSNLVSGQDFDIQLQLANSGDEKITNVKIELPELSGDKVINRESNTIYIDEINANEKKEVTLKLTSFEDLQTGNYPIKVKVSYKNTYGDVKEFFENYYVKVSKQTSNLLIGEIKASKRVLKGEDEFTLTVPIMNLGDKSEENIFVTAIGSDGIVNNSQSMVMIGSVEGKETKVATFNFRALKDITEGNKTIAIKVTYGNKNIDSGYVVYSEKTDGNTSVPKIIISKYTPEPMMVKAGQEFDLNLAFLNTHRDKTVRNIKITLTTHESSEKTGSVFSPVNSSNTFFIDEITPKNESEMNITMFTIPDAKSKTYTIDVKMEYEDEKGTQYSATDLIGIPVRQQSKFMTSDINVPEQIGIGEPIRLDIDISNTGKIDLANFTVKIEGDFNASNSTTYVGNIQPGAREYYDVDLFATKEGENIGTFIFSYEEPSGDIVEKKVEIKTNGFEVKMPEINNNNNNSGGVYPPDMNNKSLGEKQGFPWVKLAIGGVVVLIVVIIIVRAAKKRKRKKEMELDE
ncbi:COG1361 S-layer family protein [Oceanirhabdus sp. W0125-5]|uniref:COG1361 S-layer family protein n=1 Tax=Oceanirhabdus sp. W0125-5 TaxID=2999116 RepID=UPI0022F322D6|nr:CARDB domain-containing protein [Oceanirhabdus sp. W0125-5]WBW98650.1 CARDB domain-containing protein [Oceanirhabdus sp. W0125-5]